MAGRSSERLRRRLVAELRAKGAIRSAEVERAFRAVARERFIAGVVAEHGLEAIYRDEAFVTKRDARGMPLSSSSQPSLMAEMLELLDVQPGDRVLEVGAGTGYNAALLSHIAGRTGRVTTIDVDPEIARNATAALRDAGYRASVLTGDGREALPRRGRSDHGFDRIIATGCADEIPRAWRDQLTEGGRLELPLRLDPDGAAIQLIVVLERRGDRLRSVGLTWGGFMPLHRGDGGWRQRPPTIGVSRSGRDSVEPLISISGAALRSMSDRLARELLASALSDNRPPLARGLTELDSGRPPLLLIYLLLSIPAARRVSVRGEGRLGIGTLHRRDGSLAVISVRSPWTLGAPYTRAARARWRLDSYGRGSDAASELQQLLAGWRGIARRGPPALEVTADGRAEALRVRFEWRRG